MLLPELKGELPGALSSGFLGWPSNQMHLLASFSAGLLVVAKGRGHFPHPQGKPDPHPLPTNDSEVLWYLLAALSGPPLPHL